MVEKDHPHLSIAEQCRLLSISRSAFYYEPKDETALNLALMRQIDEQFLETPFYGVRRMTWHLRAEGHLINEKRIRQTRSGDETRLRKELGEVERSIARCVEFVTSGDGASGAVRDKLAELEARKRSLERALAAHPDTRVVEIHPNFPDLYRRKVAELGSLLADDNERPRAMEAIRGLIDRIEVLPGLKRGQCQVTLVGALAGILAFSQNPTAAQKGGGTFLLVGETRNQHYLLFAARGLTTRQMHEKPKSDKSFANPALRP